MVTVVGFEVLMKVGSEERIVGLIFDGLALGELVGSMEVIGLDRCALREDVTIPIILGLRDDAVDVGL